MTGTLTLLRLMLHRDRVALPGWIVVIVAVIVASAAASAELYPQEGWTPRTPSSSRRATGGSPSRSTRSSPTRPTRSPTIRIWRRCTPPPQCAWATAALFVTTGILLVAGVVLILVGVRLATAPADHPRQPEPVP